MSRISALIAASNDLEEETVDIASWGVKVKMRGMTGTRRSQYLFRLVRANEEEDTDALLQLDAEIVVACTFDPEDDSQVFAESDIPMLMGKSGSILGPLATKAQRLSGLDGQAEERLGKDSSTSEPTDSPVPAFTPSVVSSSASPES